VNAEVFDFTNGLARAAFADDSIHFICDRACAVPGHTVDAGSDHEMRPRLLRHAERFIGVADVVRLVTDMNTSCRFAEKPRRLHQILQPTNALPLLDGNSRRIDPLVQGVGAFELLSRLELDRRQPERQPFRRQRQARIHQDAANHVGLNPDGAAQ